MNLSRERRKIAFARLAWESRRVTAKEVLERVADLPIAEWMKIQAGIAEMLATRFSAGEIAEVHEALAEAEAELDRGEGLSGDEVRKRFGLG